MEVTKMKYGLVSGDSHVDLSWLPGDLFVKDAPEQLKDKYEKKVAKNI